MMQSLLTGVVSAQNNDLKAHKENEKVEANSDLLQKYKLVQDQQSVSKVPQQNLNQEKAAEGKKTSIEEVIVSEDGLLENDELNSKQFSSTEKALITDINTKPSVVKNQINTPLLDPVLSASQKGTNNRVPLNSFEGLNNSIYNLGSSAVQQSTAQNTTNFISDPASQVNEIQQQQLLSIIQTATDLINDPASSSNEMQQQQLLSTIQTAADLINDPASQANEIQQQKLLSTIQTAADLINDPASQANEIQQQQLLSIIQTAADFISDPASQVNEIQQQQLLATSQSVTDLANDPATQSNEMQQQQLLATSQSVTDLANDPAAQSNEMQQQQLLATSQSVTDLANDPAAQSNEMQQQQLLATSQSVTDLVSDPATQSNEMQQQQLLSAIQAAQQVSTNVKSNTEQLVDDGVLPFNPNQVATNLDTNDTKKTTSENKEEDDLDIGSIISDSTEMVVGPISSDNKANTTAVGIEQSNTKAMQEKSVESLLSSNQNNNKNTTENVYESNKEKLVVSVDNPDQSLKANIANTGTVFNLADNPESLLKNEAALLGLKAAEQNDSLPSTLKNEGAAVVDVNGLKSSQSSFAQLDKLVATNQQQQATNNLLQQPLDLQSKHSAAMMGERVMMMISQGKQEVQIRLDPAELGSIFIKAHVQQDQLQLNIQTQAGLSKDIIEQNMPRLREQLAQQGIQLGEANVQQQSQQQGQQQRSHEVNTAPGQTSNGLETAVEEQTAAWIPSKIASTEQGIDYYA